MAAFFWGLAFSFQDPASDPAAQAEQALFEGKAERALEWVEKALAEAPEDPRLLSIRFRARQALAARRMDSAILAGANAVERVRRRMEKADATLELARQDLDPPLREIQELLPLATRSDAYYLCGEMQRLLGDWQAALDSYTRVIERDPDHVLARLSRGRLSLIRTFWQSAIQLEAGRRAAVLESGLAAARADLEILRREVPKVGIRERDAQLADCYRYIVTREYIQAIDECRRGWNKTADPEFRFTEALIWTLMERVPGALDVLGEAIERRPGDFEAIFFRGILTLSDSEEESSDDLRECLRLRPNHAWAWNAIAMLRWRKGNYEEAEEAFSRAIEFDPGRADLWAWRGTVRYAMSRIDAALSDFGWALGEDPFHAGALYGRGLCYIARWRPNEAVASLERCVEIEPNHLNAVSALARVLIELGRFGQAVGVLEKAIEDHPRAWFLYDTLAEAYRSTRKWDQALLQHDRAIENQPGNARLLLRRADTLIKLGRPG